MTTSLLLGTLRRQVLLVATNQSSWIIAMQATSPVAVAATIKTTTTTTIIVTQETRCQVTPRVSGASILNKASTKHSPFIHRVEEGK